MSFVPTTDVKIKDQGRRDVRSKELNELIGVELGKRRVAMFVVVVLVFELGRQSFSFGIIDALRSAIYSGSMVQY